MCHDIEVQSINVKYRISNIYCIDISKYDEYTRHKHRKVKEVL